MSISDSGATVPNAAESSFVVEVKKKQGSDLILLELKGAIHNQRVEVFSQGGDSVLRYKVRLCATKTYRNLWEVYWWNVMKRDIVDFVNKCPNCQQVNLSKAFHPKIDGPTERTIQTPEDMLSACVIDFKGVIRFGKKGKLSPRYVGLYKILKRVGKVAYELELPTKLAAVHLVFHIPLLKKCVGDPASIVPIESMALKDNLSYEDVPFEILDRQARRLRNKEVASIKFLWRSQSVEGDT
ncbi:uncharacterized protein [Solanum lycopersicum]|uniref:uncharacterized protein n=1 Tax=Solanum lycopersicum TaxID=4081 RepID=UPI00374A325A